MLRGSDHYIVVGFENAIGHALGRLDTPKGANPLFYLML